MKESSFLAKTFLGLESILASELINLGANNVQIARRAVSFTGNQALLYRANLCCRTALRILKPILTFKAKNADEVIEWREKYLELVARYSTAMNLPYIRYSCNTADEFYVKENDYFDEIGPQVGNLMNMYNDALLNSPFRKELEEKLSPVLFKHMEVQAKAMSPEIIEDMIEENKIVSEYSKLMASMEFEFRGEKLSRAALAGYFKSDDRETRKEAYTVLGTVMNGYTEQLDDIYDRLVKVRTKMAQKLGYKNFVELGYYRMGRVDYNEKMVAAFRKSVETDIVPAVVQLKKRIRNRLGLDEIMYYDDAISVTGEMPRPVIGTKEIFENALKMYEKVIEMDSTFYEDVQESKLYHYINN